MFALPKRPYISLPKMGERAMLKHFEHHVELVRTLNTLIDGKEQKIIERVIEDSEDALLTVASLAWAHDFYWSSMNPTRRKAPTSFIEKVEEDFHTFENMTTKFVEAAATTLGSGFVWLIEHNEKLSILKTTNADVPLRDGKKALLTLDCWEHAYMADFGHNRIAYARHFVDKLADQGDAPFASLSGFRELSGHLGHQ